MAVVTGSFTEASFSERIEYMGNSSEGAAVVALEGLGYGVERSGRNRSEIKGLSRRIWHQPDLLVGPTQWGSELEARQVEVMAVGWDRVLKRATAKVESAQRWQGFAELPVWLFVYSRRGAERTWAWLPIDEFAQACAEHGELATFPDGTPHFRVPVDLLNVAWHALPGYEG